MNEKLSTDVNCSRETATGVDVNRRETKLLVKSNGSWQWYVHGMPVVHNAYMGLPKIFRHTRIYSIHVCKHTDIHRHEHIYRYTHTQNARARKHTHTYNRRMNFIMSYKCVIKKFYYNVIYSSGCIDVQYSIRLYNTLQWILQIFTLYHKLDK